MILNEGDAFNLGSGYFTTPVKGIYHFQFSAVKSGPSKNLFIYLQVNGVNFGIAYTHQSDRVHNAAGVSLSASLRLAAGDRVNLLNNGGELYDNDNHWTHFTGWLVEEELM